MDDILHVHLKEREIHAPTEIEPQRIQYAKIFTATRLGILLVLPVNNVNLIHSVRVVRHLNPTNRSMKR